MHGVCYFKQNTSRFELFWTVLLHGINWFEHSSEKIKLIYYSFKIQTSSICFLQLIVYDIQNNLPHLV